MVSLSNHARAARESARVEGRIERTNWKRRCLAAPLFVLFLAPATGCTPAPPVAADSLIFPLCTGLLPLPDTTPDNAAREPFEEKMAQIGLFHRLDRVRLPDGRQATRYDVASSGAGALTYARKRTTSQPAIVRVCFGSARSTQFTQLVKKSDTEYFVEYRYIVYLKPWARPLYSFLHLSPQGVASGPLIVRRGPEGGLLTFGLKGIPVKYIEAPPNGVPWYGRGQFPVRFRWPPIRV